MSTLKYMLSAAFALLCLPIHPAVGQEAQALRTRWTGGGDGKSWNQGSNWSTGHPPTSTEIVDTEGVKITISEGNNEVGLLSCSKTTLTIEAGAELRVAGIGNNRISFLHTESELVVHGKLLLNSALYFTNSTITVGGEGSIDRLSPASLAFLQRNFTLNFVGDQALITNLLVFGGPVEMHLNLSLGPSGMNSINAETLEIGANSTLTIDVSQYKPKPGEASVKLFTFKGELNGLFETTIKVVGGTGKILYNEADVTLSEIVVAP